MNPEKLLRFPVNTCSVYTTNQPVQSAAIRALPKMSSTTHFGEAEVSDFEIFGFEHVHCIIVCCPAAECTSSTTKQCYKCFGINFWLRSSLDARRARKCIFACFTRVHTSRRKCIWIWFLCFCFFFPWNDDDLMENEVQFHFQFAFCWFVMTVAIYFCARVPMFRSTYELLMDLNCMALSRLAL